MTVEAVHVEGLAPNDVGVVAKQNPHKLNPLVGQGLGDRLWGHGCYIHCFKGRLEYSDLIKHESPSISKPPIIFNIILHFPDSSICASTGSKPVYHLVSKIREADYSTIEVVGDGGDHNTPRKTRQSKGTQKTGGDGIFLNKYFKIKLE